MNKKVIIIGSGFSSLSSACYLSKKGYQVEVFEKNESLGGRARQFKKDGFTFDMGPSWYWMPDIFERFFNDFNKSPSEYYNLKKLDPAYEVYFGTKEKIVIEGNLDKIISVFEKEENGSGKKLKKFIEKAKKNYDIAINKIVYRPGKSPLELITFETVKKLNLFIRNIKDDVFKNFKNPKLRQLLQFPVLFLGAKPKDTPAFYNFMNFADYGLGTWHPEGGIYSVIEGMVKLAKSLGVKFHLNSSVEKIIVNDYKASGVIVNKILYNADVILSGADYHHTETLLDKKLRVYSENYWSKKTFAPSSLLFYIGLNKKIKDVAHHTLFFDVDFDKHATEIYDNPKWPDDPLFYVNFPSKSDLSMAPSGKEACFILIPLAPGLNDTPTLRKKYLDLVINRLEQRTEQEINKHILFEESFCINDFISEYNSYKGNAYGMAMTLFQTAFLRPKLESKKVKGLYFCGQLTVPGPGVPPSLISGKISAGLVEKYLRKPNK
ncbi:MAG: phytoene dehydrogenase [Flavobacteriaceae bacterium]|nr:phytoene dehydrogenase [Flavobacteriaceae bacterium]|tara:strand:- start:3287 stop:4762 length:1476 start_codon:yes stop_codon:yes gene_type:complete